MPFERVKPDDAGLIATAAEILNLATRQDDPDRTEVIPELLAGMLRYGWDLEPGEMYLYAAPGSQRPVGVLEVDLPERDNRHLVWASITTHPDHRRLGHGTAMLEEVLRRTHEAGRSTVWMNAPEDDPGSRAFIERFGFRYASHDARRRQVLAEVDQVSLTRLYDQAGAAASAYDLERGLTPTPDDLLKELLDVTSAINDAPMGDLTFEDEVFDLQRLRDVETAAAGRGNTVYRIWARHRDTGQVGGHTLVVVHPLEPLRGWQGDTAVSREHRGHRLGLLLKIAMMRWLADVEPQLEVIETWNQADNRFMIDVNEAIGYRLSRVFAMYELAVES